MPDPVPGADKEAERAEKIRISFAHTSKRKRRRGRKRLPNKLASSKRSRY